MSIGPSLCSEWSVSVAGTDYFKLIQGVTDIYISSPAVSNAILFVSLKHLVTPNNIQLIQFKVVIGY